MATTNANAQKIGRALKAILPPILTQMLRRLRAAIIPDSIGLTFAPKGWATPVPLPTPTQMEAFVSHECAQWRETWEPFFLRLHEGGPATYIDMPVETRIDAHNAWMTYAYVLSLAAKGKSRVRILDYGGNFGYFYRIGRALQPGISLEYHCKELPEIEREGRKVTPEAIWHTDDSCLDQKYDLLIFSGVLQYIEAWKGLLSRASAAADPYIYMAQTPVVESVGSYIAIQRLCGLSVLHCQFNKAELQKCISAAGLRVVREFVEEDHYRIYGAPEQPRYYGCLLAREPGPS